MYSAATTIAPTAIATRVLSSGEDAAGTLGGVSSARSSGVRSVPIIVVARQLLLDPSWHECPATASAEEGLPLCQVSGRPVSH